MPMLSYKTNNARSYSLKLRLIPYFIDTYCVMIKVHCRSNYEFFVLLDSNLYFHCFKFFLNIRNIYCKNLMKHQHYQFIQAINTI